MDMLAAHRGNYKTRQVSEYFKYMALPFKFEDRVMTLREVTWYECKIPAYSYGTVKGYGFTGNPLVEFDEPIGGGHNGIPGARGKHGHCWLIWPSNLITVAKLERNRIIAEKDDDVQCMLYGE